MWQTCFFLLALAADPAEVRVLTLGDSITRGVRAGVKADETFQAQVQELLRGQKVNAEVINAGVGGERTDQALKRLGGLLKKHTPHVVAIMYGHNDSHIDRGQKQPRLSLAEYEANLRLLVEQVQKAGARPVLMTPPCYSRKSLQGGVAENPNVQLVKYAGVVRKLAGELKVPLVDNYAHWHARLDKGEDVQEWTTDGYHPNKAGHAEIARTMVPVVAGKK